MAGAVYGGYLNRRQTLLLSDALRGDLRRRPLATALTGHAVSRLLQPALGRRAVLRRRVRRRPPSPPAAPLPG